MPTPEPRRRLPPLLRALILIPLGLVVGLGISEAFLRVTGLDWVLLGGLLPRVQYPLYETSRPASDPVLAREPIPGARATIEGPDGSVDVGFNSSAFRGANHAETAAPGTVRVMVYGGSNVFGHRVEDHQTWPAALERSLHRAGRSDVEIWNGGVSAYNPWQICHRASVDAPRYRPDLVILALSNFDLPRHMHPDSPDLSVYFPDERFWRDEFSPKNLSLPGSADGRATLWLIQRSALARLVQVGRTHWQRWHPPTPTAPGMEPSSPPDLNDTPARACLEVLSRRQRTMLFGAPSTPSLIHVLYAQGLDVPVFNLDAGTQPPQYRELHPPPEVYDWYGDRFAEWLIQSGLLPDPA